jgi:hypothetical protein
LISSPDINQEIAALGSMAYREFGRNGWMTVDIMGWGFRVLYKQQQ